MPRIRTIKPEFWTDGAVIALPFEARLFYIGMWNYACDRGHFSDDALGLKLKILPADAVDGEALLQLLVDAGRVVRVSLPDGRRFLSIPRFTDHQRIDTRWNSRCPLCAHLDSPNLTETHASLHELATTQREGRGGERKGKGVEVAHATLSPFCSKHPEGTDDPCRPCGTARTKYAAAVAAEKNKPTPTPRQAPECAEHRGYPLPCHRCAEGESR